MLFLWCAADVQTVRNCVRKFFVFFFPLQKGAVQKGEGREGRGREKTKGRGRKGMESRGKGRDQAHLG